jgi:hypothetical protein
MRIGVIMRETRFPRAVLASAGLAAALWPTLAPGQTADNPVEIRANTGERTVFRIPAELRDRVWPNFVSYGNTHDKKITFFLQRNTGEIVGAERARREPVTHVEVSSEHPWGFSCVIGWSFWSGHSQASLIRSDLYRGRHNAVFLALDSRRLVERRLHLIHAEMRCGIIDLLVLIHDPARDPGFLRQSYLTCGERCALDGMYKGLFVKVSGIPRTLIDERGGSGFLAFERRLKALLDSWSQ